MRRNLPQIYRKDTWIVALTDAMQGVMEAQEARARDVTVQESLDSVTWNLCVEERVAGLKPKAGATEEERRTALRAKWRSGGKLTIDQIQAVADAWKNGEIAVSFIAGRIKLTFVGEYGIPADVQHCNAQSGSLYLHICQLTMPTSIGCMDRWWGTRMGSGLAAHITRSAKRRIYQTSFGVCTAICWT